MNTTTLKIEKTMTQFEIDLKTLINKHSKENGSDTPDFILAQYLNNCLATYEQAIKARDKWWNFKPWEMGLEQEPKEPRNPPPLRPDQPKPFA